ncbi:hypothetical protein G3I43_00130 [Streptomyces anulatus]|uniref:Uncharacterized protein n=1 Tax=Streptomyces anulatus TaxID=1892 RepID=A0A6G3SI65_STRAQ|nr:hypothetical protein [Streptomyces anulatus]NEB82601.1 hypothetical protein [Streptomyces anulatus]
MDLPDSVPGGVCTREIVEKAAPLRFLTKPTLQAAFAVASETPRWHHHVGAPGSPPQDQKAPRQQDDEQPGNSASSQHQHRHEARQAATYRQDPQLVIPFLTWGNAGLEAHCYAHQEIGMKMLINVPELATELARPRHGDLSKTCSCD